MDEMGTEKDWKDRYPDQNLKTCIKASGPS